METRYEHFFVTNSAFSTNHLYLWGAAGTVKLKTSVSPKMKEKGVVCMFIGYTNDDAGDCYHVWNPKTNNVRTTRDVLWLKRMYFTRPKTQPHIVIPPTVASEARNSDTESYYNSDDEDKPKTQTPTVADKHDDMIDGNEPEDVDFLPNTIDD